MLYKQIIYMKVEIWSDVMCPFCYIGKRKFELALEKFAHKEEVEIIWKSFQLDPSIQTDPTKTVHQFLAERKGINMQQAKQMNDNVTNIAKEVGIEFNFDKALVANSFDAHRFSHLAKQNGLQNEAEESLFKSYFTDGRNTADYDTLIQIGNDIGMESDEVKKVLQNDTFSDEVKHDIYEAEQFGISGVPFFVFDRKFAVSGAQSSDVFLQTLNKVWEDRVL